MNILIVLSILTYLIFYVCSLGHRTHIDNSNSFAEVFISCYNIRIIIIIYYYYYVIGNYSKACILTYPAF